MSEQSPTSAHLRPQSPPSAYAIAALVDKEPGAALRVVTLTLQRALFIAPGLYLTGIRGKQLVKSSLGASAGISGMLTLYYWLKHKRGVELPRIE